MQVPAPRQPGRASWLAERSYPDPDCWLPLPDAFQFILLIRPGLAECNPGTEDGRLALYLWWEREGCIQFPDLAWQLSDEEVAWIDRTPGEEMLARFPKSVESWLRTSSPSQLSLEGLRVALMDAQLEFLELGIRVPFLLKHIWTHRPDLQQNHVLLSVSGQVGLVRWWQRGGRFEYPRWTWPVPPVVVGGHTRATKPMPAGVNIVGYPHGAFGLGEEARAASRCMDLAGVPNVLINAPQPGPQMLIEVPTKKLGLWQTYNTTLFCLPPVEMLHLALSGGKAFFESPEYKIGAWPWELSQWPERFSKLLGLVDEVWAHSHFVADAFRAQTDRPVLYMPMAVEVPEAVRDMRQVLAVPGDDFVFLVMFDGNSWLSRKNPLAGVQAFARAFPPAVRGVRLLVKAMNVGAADSQWDQICKLASVDDRIQIVNRIMSRQDAFDLMHCCDAYVSLHRSEGFGRVIAESMLMGKPVVATNYSGNVDFCTATTAFLVGGEQVPLKPGDYLLADGQFWCDPDIDAAAMQLLSIIEDPALRKRVADAGQTLIHDQFSVDAIAQKYRLRLAEIAGTNSPEAS